MISEEHRGRKFFELTMLKKASLEILLVSVFMQLWATEDVHTTRSALINLNVEFGYARVQGFRGNNATKGGVLFFKIDRLFGAVHVHPKVQYIGVFQRVYSFKGRLI